MVSKNGISKIKQRPKSGVSLKLILLIFQTRDPSTHRPIPFIRRPRLSRHLKATEAVVAQNPLSHSLVTLPPIHTLLPNPLSLSLSEFGLAEPAALRSVTPMVSFPVCFSISLSCNSFAFTLIFFCCSSVLNFCSIHVNFLRIIRSKKVLKKNYDPRRKLPKLSICTFIPDFSRRDEELNSKIAAKR